MLTLSPELQKIVDNAPAGKARFVYLQWVIMTCFKKPRLSFINRRGDILTTPACIDLIRTSTGFTIHPLGTVTCIQEGLIEGLRIDSNNNTHWIEVSHTSYKVASVIGGVFHFTDSDIRFS